MIDENKYEQYGFIRELEDIKGITIHETNNYTMNAKELEEYMNTKQKTSQGTHFFVDWGEYRQAMPLNYAVSHTGKAKDWGCRYTIAIEIVDNLNDELFERAVDRTIALIHELQELYSIPNDMIFFHNDWDNKTYCPHKLLDDYKTSKNFVYQRLED